jgi:hypothetical protein
MSEFGFLIFPTGEKYIRFILKTIQEKFTITDIFRRRTMNEYGFEMIMTKMYRDIAPAKLEKAISKIKAQGYSTSFLWILVEGHKDNIRPTKRKIRFATGLNCVHTSDNPPSTKEHTKLLVGEVELSKAPKKLNLDHVFDFSCRQFIPVGADHFGNRYAGPWGIFNVLSDWDLNYVVVQFGVSIDKNVFEHNKDIEIICSDRTRAIDRLGADYAKKNVEQPHKGAYLVYTRDLKKIKIDFSLSVFLPERWRNKILATKRSGHRGYYAPTDEDIYWVTMWERVIYKPRKFRVGTPKFAEGATWEKLVRWGIDMGLHPQIRLKSSLQECQDAVREYMNRL